MPTKNMIYVKPETHKLVKILAVQEQRKLHGDLIDDLILLGVEAFESAKNFAKNVNSTVYTNDRQP